MSLKRALGIIGLASLVNFSALAVDSDLPTYKKTSGISGNLSSVGSDTLANMMTFWAEEFKRTYPNVNVQIQAAGSSTAPPALTEATSNLGPMSRKMKSREIESFEERYGYKPTAVRVAIDALAVFVHKDNPIKGLRIDQVDAIFSSNRKCGALKDADRWADLGLTGDWAGKDIQLYGRNSVSGTYGYFKSKALCKGDFKKYRKRTTRFSVSCSICISITKWYRLFRYWLPNVWCPCITFSEKGDDFIEANMENAIAGKYPLSRYLYVYVNKHPNKPLDPMTAEFLKMVLSKSGQKIVEKDGYIPLPNTVVEKEFAKLGLTL